MKRRMINLVLNQINILFNKTKQSLKKKHSSAQANEIQFNDFAQKLFIANFFPNSC